MFNVIKVKRDEALRYHGAGFPVYQRAFTALNSPEYVVVTPATLEVPAPITTQPDIFEPPNEEINERVKKRLRREDKLSLNDREAVRENPHYSGTTAYKVRNTVIGIMQAKKTPVSLGFLIEMTSKHMGLPEVKIQSHISACIHRTHLLDPVTEARKS